MKQSPFSGGANWKVEYANISPRWEGVTTIWQDGNRNRTKTIAKLLYNCKFLTGVQIAQSPLFNGSYGTAKKRLNLLARSGYLTKHYIIKNNNKKIPFYSLGSQAYKEDIQEEYIHNFYTEYSLLQILKILSINQLYIKLLPVAHIKITYDNLIEPYNAKIKLLPRLLGKPIDNQEKIQNISIISMRNYAPEEKELLRQYSKLNERTIIISHSKNKLINIINNLQNNDLCRFTFDTDLFKKDLDIVFYKVEDKNLINTKVPMLMK